MSQSDLPDYKFFCFNGEPNFCQVISGCGRDSKMCIDFFDIGWKHLPFYEPYEFPFAEKKPQKPIHFKQMLDLARKLANGNPFSRIDFYDTGEKVLFGDFTLFPTSGMGGFCPKDFDTILGRMINIDY